MGNCYIKDYQRASYSGKKCGKSTEAGKAIVLLVDGRTDAHIEESCRIAELPEY